ncbi:MAG: TolC family protein [Bacteroidota bacterium]|nr:TolC family protein [Bacteroidota bacterium]
MKRTNLLTVLLLLLGIVAQAQSLESLTLEECYNMARTNYPLIRQQGLIQSASDFNVENIVKGNLPQINLNAQASYQTEVTRLPIEVPGIDVPVLDKDQYQVYAEINQKLFDGGKTNKKVKIQEALQDIEEGQLEVQLYDIYKRVSQLYFGILLAKEQILQNDLQEKDIQLAMDRVQTRIQNGAAIESDLFTLKANQLSIHQRTTELMSLKKAYYQMLSIFIGRDVNEETLLVRPQEAMDIGGINRLEVSLFDKQMSLLDLQSNLLNTKIAPSLSLFGRAGYGKPGLNMLSNEFDSYFLGGARLQWPLFNLYTNKKEKEINKIEKEKLQTQKETFLFNTKMELTQQQTEIDKFRKLLEMDDTIIESYAKVKDASLFKLDNGTIDVNDYIRDVNQESRAIQNKLLHEIQLLMKREELKITQGI